MPTADQDYKIVTTPEKKVSVKLRNYTTGADDSAVSEVLAAANTTVIIRDGSVDESGKPIQREEIRVAADVTDKLNRLLVSLFVVEVDGKTENVLDAVFNLRKKDYDYVSGVLMELANGLGGLDVAEKKT